MKYARILFALRGLLGEKRETVGVEMELGEVKGAASGSLMIIELIGTFSTV